MHVLCRFSFAFLLILSINAVAKHQVYLIPGQGADERLFKNIALDTSRFETHFIRYEIPDKCASLSAYALKLSKQIDTSKPFSLIGVSLGGMIAMELTDLLNPFQTIIISSAKHRQELPLRYRFQKSIPIYALLPAKWYKSGAMIAQPIVEPDRKQDPETFDKMLQDKNPLFLKRTSKMIIHWNRESAISDSSVIHIHGNNDKTLPGRKVSPTHWIEQGSHMMVLTKAEEINAILSQQLKTD